MEKHLSNISALNELCHTCKCNYYNTFNDHTALILAAQASHSHCVKVLIAAGADVNVRNTLGETALMHAARVGDGDCVKILLKLGADVKLVNFNGENAMTYAVGGSYDSCWRLRERFPTMTMEDHNASVHALLKAGADINIALLDGFTLLMGAAQRGCEMCVDFLVQTGADVNFRNTSGETALMYAAKEGSGDCVQILLKFGADVNIVTNSGESVISYALRSNYNGCFLLKAHYHGVTVENHNASVCALVKAGADVNTSERDGSTLLMKAVKRGCETCVNFLIQAGADVNVECMNGDTALIAASRNTKSTKVLKLLTNAGADASVVINKGLGIITPLMLTVERISNPTLVQQAKILLKAGARINVSGQYSYNALELYISWHRQWGIPDRTMVLLLQAAGESSHRLIKSLIHIPSYFQEVDINLKQFCRDTIRKHLLNLNSEENLFYRVPRLGLPKILSQYILYDVCIDDD